MLTGFSRKAKHSSGTEANAGFTMIYLRATPPYPACHTRSHFPLHATVVACVKPRRTEQVMSLEKYK